VFSGSQSRRGKSNQEIFLVCFKDMVDDGRAAAADILGLANLGAIYLGRTRFSAQL